MPHDDDILLRADDLACWFDVSPPWLERTLSRQPPQTLKAVDGVSLAVPRGTTLSIVGESGCGKSTLAKLLVGLVAPTRGALRYGRSRTGGALHPQMIFQDPYASLNPRWRVGAIVAEPIVTLGLRATPADTRRRVEELLTLVGLSPNDASRYPHEFSGGQRQRISIARALATQAEFLVCDEPTSALDVSVQAQILNLMGDLQKEFGLTYVFISHNLSVVRHVSDRVAVMYLGRIVEQAPADELFDAPEHPYTRMLLDTIPDLDSPRRDREPMGGEVPNPIQPPSGCTFHPRCPNARAVCRERAPEVAVVGGREVRCHAVEWAVLQAA
ncbi:ABC transporter ATP-binding protein [Achromobacter ruhlandii]|uniref:ABC transporter ATP-binding protein n=1 Tax=Achromobacter ruhlandii TaxID=72557 RepID=UPI001EED83C5|nr:oligopeptide/dipeptide ABC transporter ATP-binding protein [Achromobacter ruhlandii]MCZ8397609.1 ATP-binding cassette domain-containing protein [Achromobacter ruhlandii]